MMIEFQYSLEELPQVASEIIQKTASKTLLFYGEIGVGKTTLIKELVKQLGSEDVVSSPTFSLVNEYATKTDSLFHFDLYRIEDEMEVMDIGFEEYLDYDTWIFIEWPEKIPNLLPEDAQKIYLKRNKSGKNSIKF
ncbi:MAG TPA: tRNA (adenosine(37)-N6)-threonylcarbamoyltransferase complex ATPase subunit type 1 TsaE [Flavobacteriaceae bacterium]|nr:tRNA (adenosine(37)-N6)-threonylcarbamoyltransferase complex ATPase subunit type 1 TsaE [Flavobacteriaceae bacterium]